MHSPSDDARLTHEQVAEGGAHYIHEICNPTIYPAANGRELASMTLNSRREGAIVLARSHGAPQAYGLTHSPEQAIRLYLSLGGPRQQQERGRIYFAALCPAIGNNDFEVPQVRQEVAIKVLNKLVIQEYLNRRPGGENPYKELARMEEIGDNVHVLKHIEALEDERHLYIVMPKGVESLDKYVQRHIDNGQDIPPARCHEIFCKIVQICAYLLKNNINHHDLSPDNLLFLTETNLVLMDFALSNRIPVNPDTRRRTLIAPPIGAFFYGKPGWMDAIVHAGHRGYDGAAMDLYAAGLILYFLTTRIQLYQRPLPHVDPSYHHFIHLQGLWNRNEQTIDNLAQVGTMAQATQNETVLNRLLGLSMLHMNIHPQVMHLLMNMLHENPALRLTLAQVMESNYVKRFQG